MATPFTEILQGGDAPDATDEELLKFLDDGTGNFNSADAGRFRMIKTETISSNALRVTAPEKLKADDFRQITPQIDSLISQHGKIRLLIDASGFNGWENIAAFENHAGFIKNHHQKIERIAVIATHDWQHWVIGAVRMFVHPEVRAYDKSHESEALQWIVG